MGGDHCMTGWLVLQREIDSVRQQLEATAAAEAFEEAHALQAELDAAVKEAQELAASQGLDPSQLAEAGTEAEPPHIQAADLLGSSEKAEASLLGPPEASLLEHQNKREIATGGEREEPGIVASGNLESALPARADTYGSPSGAEPLGTEPEAACTAEEDHHSPSFNLR